MPHVNAAFVKREVGNQMEWYSLSDRVAYLLHSTSAVVKYENTLAFGNSVVPLEEINGSFKSSSFYRSNKAGQADRPTAVLVWVHCELKHSHDWKVQFWPSAYPQR